MSDPNALCFGAEFAATGSPCHVAIASSGIRVRVDDPPPDASDRLVSFTRLSVSVGGVNHDQLVLTWNEEPGRLTLYVKDPALIRAFREAAPAELSGTLEEAAMNVRRVRGKHRTLWGILLGVVLMLALSFWFGSTLLVEFAVSRIPIEWEQKLGEAAYQDFLTQQTVVTHGPSVAAVQELTQRLTERIPDNPYRFRVTVVQSDAVNAFALPGGYVVVFTGLMKKAESGEEVAGVLSHELNHVLQRHGLHRIVKQVGLGTVLAIVMGNQQGLLGLMKDLSLELLTLRFGREQETEADLAGLHLLHRAQIDPGGMIRFFERLSEQDKERIEILATHPMSTARAARLRVELAALPKQTPEPFTFEWKAVQNSLS